MAAVEVAVVGFLSDTVESVLTLAAARPIAAEFRHFMPY